MKFCPKCGNETEEKFCDQCGTEMPIQQVAVENKDHNTLAAFTDNKMIPILIAVFSIGAILILLWDWYGITRMDMDYFFRFLEENEFMPLLALIVYAFLGITAFFLAKKSLNWIIVSFVISFLLSLTSLLVFRFTPSGYFIVNLIAKFTMVIFITITVYGKDLTQWRVFRIVAIVLPIFNFIVSTVLPMLKNLSLYRLTDWFDTLLVSVSLSLLAYAIQPHNHFFVPNAKEQ